MEDHVLEIVGLDSESGLITGDFLGRRFLSTTFASRDAIAKIPPLFFTEDFLSGMDNRRIRRFRAQSRLGRDGKETGNRRGFPNELWAEF